MFVRNERAAGRAPFLARSRAQVVTRTIARPKRRMRFENAGPASDGVDVVSVNPDGSDAWRLNSIIDALKNGEVGIIPTDTLPALVCCVEDRKAAAKLYAIKELDPKKPLSILCRSFADVSTYTTGFSAASEPGAARLFPILRRILPGPYTLIMPASKNLPSQIVDFMRLKTKHRKSVGVRIPDNALCQAILEGVGQPLLATSVHVPEHLSDDTEVPDTGTLLEEYGARGISFVVDVPPYIATRSTIIDLTGPLPVLVREGKGDVSMFNFAEAD